MKERIKLDNLQFRIWIFLDTMTNKNPPFWFNQPNNSLICNKLPLILRPNQMFAISHVSYSRNTMRCLQGSLTTSSKWDRLNAVIHVLQVYLNRAIIYQGNNRWDIGGFTGHRAEVCYPVQEAGLGVRSFSNVVEAGEVKL
ncbi:unnamed protein product [Ilex paraguariensis]|uniref:Uncharacterized protein n=1 Tax=Ilex paraguariensis TaxID=185542 RepID=A0ABC8R4P3_9AQUA